MASVQVQYRGQIVDGLLIPASVVSYLSLPDTATLAQTTAALGVWANAVDDCIDGAFEGVQATIVPPLPGGLKAPTGPTWEGSRVGDTGELSFSATGTSRRYGLALPSIANSAITGGKLPLTGTAIAALVALLLNPTGFFVNPENESLVAALDAWLAFRKRSIIRQKSYTL